ncbi:MAG: DUF1631 family protein [Rubrivivax sp.]|nr:MAG: DUF1631 family protein [Rubrivivax sp.]
MPLGSPRELARLARRTYLETLRHGAGDLVSACVEGARVLASLPQPGDVSLYARRRDLVIDLPRFEAPWRQALQAHLDEALEAVTTGSAPHTRPAGLGNAAGQFSLVEDAVIELDMMVSRLSNRLADRAGWEYTDLSSRLTTLEQRSDVNVGLSGEVLKPAVFARWVLDAWMSAGIGLDHFKTLQSVVQEESAHLAEEAYHEANRVLLDHGVRPEIDLRPFIRRAKDSGIVRSMAPSAGVSNLLAAGGMAGTARTGHGAGAGGVGGSSLTGQTNRVTGPGGLGRSGHGGATERGAYDETRLMTQAPGLRLGHQAGLVVGAALGGAAVA